MKLYNLTIVYKNKHKVEFTDVTNVYTEGPFLVIETLDGAFGRVAEQVALWNLIAQEDEE